MPQAKGFSLIEVLISLFLTALICLAFLKQSDQSNQWLTQLVMRTQASAILDQINETLLLGDDKVAQRIPPPYQVTQLITNYDRQIKIEWAKDRNYLIRTLIIFQKSRL